VATTRKQTPDFSYQIGLFGPFCLEDPLDNESVRQELSRNAVNFAGEQDWENLAVKMEDLCRQVVRRDS
jgi:hypothetical protein